MLGRAWFPAAAPGGSAATRGLPSGPHSRRMVASVPNRFRVLMLSRMRYSPGTVKEPGMGILMEPVFELPLTVPPRRSGDRLRSLHGQLRAAILGGRLQPG